MIETLSLQRITDADLYLAGTALHDLAKDLSGLRQRRLITPSIFNVLALGPPYFTDELIRAQPEVDIWSGIQFTNDGDDVRATGFLQLRSNTVTLRPEKKKTDNETSVEGVTIDFWGVDDDESNDELISTGLRVASNLFPDEKIITLFGITHSMGKTRRPVSDDVVGISSGQRTSEEEAARRAGIRAEVGSGVGFIKRHADGVGWPNKWHYGAAYTK